MRYAYMLLLLLVPSLAWAAPVTKSLDDPCAISWQANTESDLAGYRVESAPGSQATIAPRTTGATEVSCWDSIIQPGTYDLQVRAYDTSGNVSDPSDPATVIVTEGAPLVWSAAAQNPSGTWRTSSWSDVSLRIRLKGSAITSEHTQVRLRLHGRDDRAYRVRQVSLAVRDGGGLDSQSGTFRQVTFGTNWEAEVEIPQGGQLISDPINLAITPNQDLWFTAYIPSGQASVYRDSGSDPMVWSIPGEAGSAAADWSTLSPTQQSFSSVYVLEALIESTDPVEPACGNGIIEPPEECDDGNIVSGDGCSSVCTIEEPNTDEQKFCPIMNITQSGDQLTFERECFMAVPAAGQ